MFISTYSPLHSGPPRGTDHREGFRQHRCGVLRSHTLSTQHGSTRGSTPTIPSQSSLTVLSCSERYVYGSFAVWRWCGAILLLAIIMTYAVDTLICERGFGLMNNLKTPRRLLLGNLLLRALMTICNASRASSISQVHRTSRTRLIMSERSL